MAFPLLAAAAAGATGLKGGFNAFLNNQKRQSLLSSQRAEVRQRNRLNRLQDQQAFDAYMRQVKAETEAYELKKETVDRQIVLNNSSYQRVIETNLTNLSDLSDNFIAKAQARRSKVARATGAAAASGMTGVTAERANTYQRGAAGRQEAMEGATKERAVGKYIFNTKLAQEQVEQANYRAWAEVAIPPTFGAPPVSRGLINRPADTTGSALLGDIAGVAADTALAFVGGLPKKATIPGAQGTSEFDNPLDLQPVEDTTFEVGTAGIEGPVFSPDGRGFQLFPGGLPQAGISDSREALKMSFNLGPVSGQLFPGLL